VSEQNEGVSFLGYVLGALLLVGVAVPVVCCFGTALIGAFQ